MVVCASERNDCMCFSRTLIPLGAANESLRLCTAEISMRGKHLIVPALVGTPTNDKELLKSDEKIIVPLTDPPIIQSASELDKWYRSCEEGC